MEYSSMLTSNIDGDRRACTTRDEVSEEPELTKEQLGTSQEMPPPSPPYSPPIEDERRYQRWPTLSYPMKCWMHSLSSWRRT